MFDPIYMVVAFGLLNTLVLTGLVIFILIMMTRPPGRGGMSAGKFQRRDYFKLQNLKHLSISDLPVDTVIPILEKEFKPDL